MSYEERKNKYENVRSPEELLEFMEEYIKYGFVGIDNKLYDNWESDVSGEFQIACQTKYGLCDAEKILKYGYGVCWDQVELERDWFFKNGYEFKTIYIWFLFENENNYLTHTYLVYKEKDSNKYCYFEHSDSNNIGIHKFNTYKEAIEYQKNRHIEFNASVGNLINDDVLKHLVIYEFDCPEFGCSMNKYIDNILESKIIYKDNRYIDLCN